MKTELSIIFLFFLLTSKAQVKLFIGDSSIVKYEILEGYKELDSIIFIHDPNDPQNQQVKRRYTENGREITLALSDFSYCEPYQVFFDKKFHKLAYSSESTGDTCKTFDYWRNGKLKKKTIYCKKKYNYPYKYYEEVYCENGNLIQKGLQNPDGMQLIVSYYCNGNKKREFNWEKGKLEGKWTEWFENGKLKLESFYEHNSPYGEWKYWTEEGNLSKTELYKDARLIKTIHY